MAKITTGGAISVAFGSIGLGWRKAWAPLALSVLLSGAAQYISKTKPADFTLLVGLLDLASAPFLIMVIGAVYRVALQPVREGDLAYEIGPAGLQWRSFEWRILGAALFVDAIAIALFIVICLVWGVAVGLTMGHGAMAGGLTAATLRSIFMGPALVPSLVILGAGFAALVYLVIRLYLLKIFFADHRRFDLGAAWALSRGVSGAIFLALLALSAGLLFAGVVAGIFGVVIAPIIGLPARAGAAILSAMVGAAVSGPAQAGLAAYAYRAQTRATSSVAEVFS